MWVGNDDNDVEIREVDEVDSDEDWRSAEEEGRMRIARHSKNLDPES